MTRLALLVFTLIIIILTAPSSSTAQGRGSLELARLPSPARIEGLMTDSAWESVAALPLTSRLR